MTIGKSTILRESESRRRQCAALKLLKTPWLKCRPWMEFVNLKIIGQNSIMTVMIDGLGALSISTRHGQSQMLMAFGRCSRLFVWFVCKLLGYKSKIFYRERPDCRVRSKLQARAPGRVGRAKKPSTRSDHFCASKRAGNGRITVEIVLGWGVLCILSNREAVTKLELTLS